MGPGALDGEARANGAAQEASGHRLLVPRGFCLTQDVLNGRGDGVSVCCRIAQPPANVLQVPVQVSYSGLQGRATPAAPQHRVQHRRRHFGNQGRHGEVLGQSLALALLPRHAFDPHGTRCGLIGACPPS